MSIIGIWAILHYDCRHSLEYDGRHSQRSGDGMAGEVRQRMSERTAILLGKKGLQGTSFSEVLEASGAPRGSLYHHFPGGKAELVLAAIVSAGGRASAVLDGLHGAPAVRVAEAFLGLWRLVLEKS